MKKNIISVGSGLGFLSIAVGAFGAHAIKGMVDDELLAIYQTGAHYMTIHALAIVLYGIWLNFCARDYVKCWPAAAFMLGTIFFSGSLFAITFTGVRTFGAITPVGGLLLMVGWIGFSIQAYRHPRP